MINKEKKMLSFMANLALKSAERQADSACLMFGYEPKKPESLKKNRK